MASVPRASTRAVSRSESATTLPEIPLLAPLEPITVPRQRTNETIVTTSSVTSHDTFMTALTSSPSSNSPNNNAKLNSHLTSPHTLRKSISVDSFIRNRRSPDLSEPGPSSSVREYPRDSFDSDSGHDRDLEAWSPITSNLVTVERPPRATPSKSLASRILGRARGHSLSGPSVAEYDDPYLDDSEHERSTDMAHLPLLPSQRSRSASSPLVNGYSRGKRPRPGDVLLLPPRTPTLSNASSASSLSSATNGTLYAEDIPPVPPIPHLHHRRSNIPGPLVMPHRTRSESLGGRRESLSASEADVSIAVVGALGCGKSTVIRKGLKNWGLGDESVCSVATAKGRLRYTSRNISIPPGQQSARLAHVFELDSDTLYLDSPDGAWPESLPRIDGVLVCYDASDSASFGRVPDLLACYQALHLSAVAIACKCDLEKKVPPHWASNRVTQYNVGLVEVTSESDTGKKKMRHCFSWILRAVAHAKRGDVRAGSPYRNPASPDVLTAPWADGFPEMRTGSARSHGSTPSADSPSGAKFREHPLATSIQMPASPPGTSTPTPRSPSAPTSPTRVRSTGDLLSEMERSKRESLEGRGSVMGPLRRVASASAGSLHEAQDEDLPAVREGELLQKNGSGTPKDKSLKDNEPPPMPWATLEELLEKLFFLAVSGDDMTFIEHFFLTYRKFATPRSVLLGMQKRVRRLNMEHTDMLLGSYAQMRICDLLEDWIEQYPHDFATPGACGALTALVKQLLSNPSTIHYGSDLLPFLDELPQLYDIDACWGVRMDVSREESDDDGAGILDYEDEEALRKGRAQDPPTASVAEEPVPDSKSSAQPVTRERKGSLSSKSLLSNPLTTTLSGSSENSRVSAKSVPAPKASIKDLLKMSQALSQYEMLDVAEEITRQQSELFMSIEPRQWLRYTMGNCRPESDRDEPISGSAAYYNRLSNWVTSLILAHDRIKTRSRQVERFSELAGKLRVLNNYAGLRAVMTGINNATYPNDEVMIMFLQNKKDDYKLFRSYEVLLNSTRNHRAYRMALKHTGGPAIPDMEVHTFDMVRAHESNDDHKANDPSKIHWGKFTLMARMITTLHGFQKKIASTHRYEFAEQPHIKRLLMEAELMDEDMQRARVIPPPDDTYEVPYPSSFGVDSPNATKPDAARFKRLFFW